MKSTENVSDGGGWGLLFCCWLIAVCSTLGSLFFSVIMGLPPCVLCWYQRIFLFPLAFLFTTALLVDDKRVGRYALPLVVAGWLVALYHNLLYTGIIPERIQPCSTGVSCTQDSLDLFGFITIPMLSWLAFTSILVLLLMYNRRISR